MSAVPHHSTASATEQFSRNLAFHPITPPHDLDATALEDTPEKQGR